MKKIILLLLAVAIAGSCVTPRERQNLTDFKSAFKRQVFIRALVQLYGDDYLQILVNQDMSSSNNMERLAPYYNSKADSLGKVFAEEVNSLPEGYLIEGKRTIMNYCLEYYTSKRLSKSVDSILRAPD